jgi:gamma-tubulin complex component 3
LEALVARAAGEVDGRVMEQLWGRHHLAAHCDAVRRYLLLGQGDWVLALLDAAAGELSKPAREVGGCERHASNRNHVH